MCVVENYVPFERHPVEDCYHIYSDGTRVSVLFERDEDKVYGRNLIAILAFKYHIRVYCDVVMGTHFHLVGKGDPENIHRFVAEMKRLLVRYFRQTHRPELVKESVWIKADPILDDVELARKIIYVFRNPLDAGDPLLPENYPWGVGRLFFQKDTAVAAKRIGDMTLEERRTLFRTRIDLPPDWEVDANGMLLPRCYIDLDEVHRLFRSPRRYLSFLFIRKKDITEQDEQCARPFLEIRTDKQLRAEAHAESLRLFHLPITKLTEPDRLRIASLLWQNRRTFSRKQLARATHLSPPSSRRCSIDSRGGWGRAHEGMGRWETAGAGRV